MAINRKGFYFTVDALLFCLLLFGAVSIVGLPTARPISATDTISTDLMGILSELKVKNVNATFVQTMIANGTISDGNVSVMQQVGEFWSKGQFQYATDLFNQVVASVVPSRYGYGLWINSDLIYATSTPPNSQRSSGWRIISGIEKAKPVRGFVANAHATAVTVNFTNTIGISPQGSGWHTGNVTITRYFNLTNVTVTSAILQMSQHADTTTTGVRVNINNRCNLTRANFTWIYNDEADIARKSVTSCLVNGSNFAAITLRNVGYNAHTHPGLGLVLNYTSTVPLSTSSRTVTTRYYLDDVISYENNSGGSGVWTAFPFFIPTLAQNISANIQIMALNVRNYTSYAVDGCLRISGVCGGCGGSTSGQFSDWNGNCRAAGTNDIIVFLNGNSPILQLGNKTGTTNITINRTQAAPYLVNGTNMLLVYVNNFADTAWGRNWTRIYSNPNLNGSNSSYVNLVYDLPDDNKPYGMVEVNVVRPFGGLDSYDKRINFTYPSQAQFKGDVYTYVIQRYSTIMQVWAEAATNPPTTKVYESPTFRAHPSTLFFDNSLFALAYTVTNYIRIYDTNQGSNNYLNDSQLDVRYFVPSFVGYGNVFANSTDAITDASARLNATVGSFLSVVGVNTQTSSITSVPTLWGPTNVEVRVWS